MSQRKIRPLILSDRDAAAVAAGHKTMFRRVMDPQPDGGSMRFNGDYWEQHLGYPLGHDVPRWPSGSPGDLLWVRETWKYYDWTDDGQPHVCYRADGATKLIENVPRMFAAWAELSRDENYMIDGAARDRRWRPAIHMPRWVSRSLLQIESVQIEPLWDITDEDAEAEGVLRAVGPDGGFGYSFGFARAWNRIHGDDPVKGWHANPWVWAISFQLLVPRSGAWLRAMYASGQMSASEALQAGMDNLEEEAIE